MNRNGGVLSGGLQQQLAIARCLMGEPEMILLDEPTEGIQPNVVMEIADTLRKIAEETGITIVVVEQNLKFARRLAEKFVIIQKGAVVSSGNMNELSDDLIHLSLAYFVLFGKMRHDVCGLVAKAFQDVKLLYHRQMLVIRH